MSLKFEGTGDAPKLTSKDEDTRPVKSVDVKPEMEKGDAQFVTHLQSTNVDYEFVEIFSTALIEPRFSEIYPRMQLEGRLYSRKGIIPMSLIQSEDVIKENHQRSWINEVFFRISRTRHLDNEPRYMAQFYMKKSVTELPEMYCIKDIKTEYLREPDLNRLPPIRSHARGLLTRHSMDVIDGIRFHKTTTPSLSLWVTPHQRTDQEENQLYLRADNQLQADCVDAVTKYIVEAAVSDTLKTLPSLWGNGSFDRVLSEPIKEELGITEVENKPKRTTGFKKYLTKRCRQFFRTVFGCTRRQTVEDL